MHRLPYRCPLHSLAISNINICSSSLTEAQFCFWLSQSLHRIRYARPLSRIHKRVVSELILPALHFILQARVGVCWQRHWVPVDWPRKRFPGI